MQSLFGKCLCPISTNIYVIIKNSQFQIEILLRCCRYLYYIIDVLLLPWFLICLFSLSPFATIFSPINIFLIFHKYKDTENEYILEKLQEFLMIF